MADQKPHPVEKAYRVVVADPPWPSMHQRSTYHRGKPERHYSTMPVDDICALPVSDWAAEDAHLWVWGVNRLMEDAYRVVRAWGFTPMGLLTWCKRGPGMGYYLRTNTEQCILATRGKPMVPEVKAMSSWYEWPRRRHSQKPDEFYSEVVDVVSPPTLGPRLDMFARSYREGWDSWGDEAPRRSDVSRVLDVDAEGASA